jgi:hypothetical protein
MKKVLVLAALAALVSTSAFAATGTISNSKHDLSKYASNTQQQLCVWCHTPHGGGTQAPLWNRGTATAVAVYTSSTLNATPVFATGDAQLCLTCHDGNMSDSLTNLGGAATAPIFAAGTYTSAFTSVANLGTLTNDHPVGFTYDATLVTADGALVAAATVQGYTGANQILFGTNEVWCSSCHDVHAPGLAANFDVPFLRFANNGSALCLKCHAK